MRADDPRLLLPFQARSESVSENLGSTFPKSIAVYSETTDNVTMSKHQLAPSEARASDIANGSLRAGTDKLREDNESTEVSCSTSEKSRYTKQEVVTRAREPLPPIAYTPTVLSKLIQGSEKGTLTRLNKRRSLDSYRDSGQQSTECQSRGRSPSHTSARPVTELSTSSGYIPHRDV